jgi:hypothetical protein
MNARYSIADNSPEAAAERNVPRNPHPLCRDFVPMDPPSSFWCAMCKWNRPMHDDEAHREAIAAELVRLAAGAQVTDAIRGLPMTETDQGGP